jgi:predicted DNA-binding transcriptional regulator AlpA
MNDPLLNLSEVAELTRLAPQTLYQLRARGDGPPSFRMAGRVRYRRSAVEQWITEQEAAEQDRLNHLRAV